MPASNSQPPTKSKPNPPPINRLQTVELMAKREDPKPTSIRSIQKQVLLTFIERSQGKLIQLDANTLAALAARGLIIPRVEELLDLLVLENRVSLEAAGPGVIVKLVEMPCIVEQ